ncbi:MAG: hypothetical protein AAGB04_16555 [Pseudomonadota bacterium]
MSRRVKLSSVALLVLAFGIAGCTTTLRTDVVGFEEEEKKPDRSVGSYLFGEDKNKLN